MGQERDRPAPKGAGEPPIGRIGGEGKEGKGEGKGRIRPPPFLPLPLSFLPPDGYGRGGRLGGGAQVGLLLLGAPLGAPLPLPPIYMWGAPLEHTALIPSRVRRPPP